MVWPLAIIETPSSHYETPERGNALAGILHRDYFQLRTIRNGYKKKKEGTQKVSLSIKKGKRNIEWSGKGMEEEGGISKEGADINFPGVT